MSVLSFRQPRKLQYSNAAYTNHEPATSLSVISGTANGSVPDALRHDNQLCKQNETNSFDDQRPVTDVYAKICKPAAAPADKNFNYNITKTGLANDDCVYSVAENRPQDHVTMVDSDIYNRSSGEDNDQAVISTAVYSEIDSRPEDSAQMVDSELYYSSNDANRWSIIIQRPNH